MDTGIRWIRNDTILCERQTKNDRTKTYFQKYVVDKFIDSFLLDISFTI